MNDPRFKIGIIHNGNGETFTFVAEFIENTDVYHIGEHNNQWVILKGIDGDAKFCVWISEQAVELLKALPNRPYNYQPFMQWLSRS